MTMNISQQLLFFFSAIGAFNGFLLAFYLMAQKPFKVSNQFLAAMLFMLSVRIAKSVWFYFNPELAKIFLQLGLSACLFIGPLLYLYCRAFFGQLNEMKVKWYLHLAGILITLIVFGSRFPYESYPELWGAIFYKAINWLWLAYIVLAGIQIQPLFTKIRAKQHALNHNEIILLSSFIGVSLIWLSYFTSSYTSYIAGALSFSFVLYLSVILVLAHLKQRQSNSYVNKKIAAASANELTNKLLHTMETEQLYCNANLTLPMLAKKLHIPAATLSQLLNDNLAKSFSIFINEYRITAAKHLLLSDKNLNMEGIAEQCGYNSQSTFYNAFKKLTNTTPAKYRQNFKNQAPEL